MPIQNFPQPMMGTSIRIWKSHHVLGATFKMPPVCKLPTGAAGEPLTIPQMKNLRVNYQQIIDEAAMSAVLYLAYHNHDKEFKTLDGKMIYERFLSKTNPDTLRMRLDLCLVTAAGVAPVAV